MAVSAWVYIVDYFYIKVVRIDWQTEQSYDLKAHALSCIRIQAHACSFISSALICAG